MEFYVLHIFSSIKHGKYQTEIKYVGLKLKGL